MSNKVFDELKNIITESRKDWKFNLRSDGNYSLANNKIFAYFDYVKTGVIIRARVYPNNIFLRNYNDLISISPRVNKVGSWKDEIIDIQLKEEKYITDYFNLLQAIADKKEYPLKRENNLPNNKNIVSRPVEIKISNNQNLEPENNLPNNKNIVSRPVEIKISNNQNLEPETFFNKILKYIKSMANTVKNYFYPTTIIKYENIKTTTSEEKIIEPQKPIQEINKLEIEKETNNKNNISEKTYFQDEIKNKINNLIYPFSNIYYMTYDVHNSNKDRFESMLKSFEFICAFNSIVLLSVLSKEEVIYIFKEIFNDEKKRQINIPFGKWLDLYRTTSNFLLEKDKKESFFSKIPFGEKFYKTITNDSIFKDMSKIVEKRNKVAHGGLFTDIQMKKELSEIEPFFDKIFNTLMIFENLLLIYPLDMKKNDGVYKINCNKLNGNNFPFSKTVIENKTDFETEILYLYDSKNQDNLKLYNEFVKLENCGHCGQQSFYILNKYGKDKSSYLGIHNPTHDFNVETEGILKELY